MGEGAVVSEPKLLVFIQNPWARGKLKRWDLDVWDKALRSSHFWKRLMEEVIGDAPFDVRYTNIDTPNANTDSDSGVAISHIYSCIRRLQPDVVLACGEFARSAMRDERVQAALAGIPTIGIDRIYAPFVSAYEMRGAHDYLINFCRMRKAAG